MKKVIKINESKILDIVDRIISEQTAGAQTITVSASNSLGTAPNFDGLFTLIRTLKANVEKALRGSTPYRIKNDNPEGIAIAKKQGGALKLEVTLVQSKPEDRDWYFDAALSIYSAINTDSVDIMKSRVMSKASAKAQGFSGSEKKVGVLGKNTLVLSGFKNLDPNDPEKVFKVYIMYIAAGKPEGYQEVGDEEGVETSVEQPTPTQQSTPTQQKQSEEGKIELEKVSGTFTSNNGDDAHNFKILEDKLAPILEKMYKEGVNPQIYSVSAGITKNSESSFSTRYEVYVIPSQDGKAWMGFTSRGSYGQDYVKRADGQISGKENKDGKSLEQKLKGIGAGEIKVVKIVEDKGVPFKQYFVSFTKPEQYPPHK